MSENRKDDFQDILKVQGVNFKGFGIMPKVVAIDIEIPIDSKAIYSYYCSFAGNGTTAFPSRDTICYHLSMSKDIYYKYYKILLENGLITSERAGEFPFRNTHTLISNPDKYKNIETQYNRPYNQVKFSGLKAHGFGTIARAVMTDLRINHKAKALYSYLCSFAGSGISAYPKKETILYHLGISEKTYYKLYTELLTHNYITVVQRKSKDGKFSVNDYYLNENPDYLIGEQIQANKAAKKTESPYGKNPDNEESKESPYSKIPDNGESGLNTESSPYGKNPDNEEKSALPYSKIPDSKKPDSKKPDSKNKDTIINNTIINSFKNNQSINQPSEGASEDFLSQEDFSKIVYGEMVEAHGIPYWYKEDKERLTTAVHILTNWGTVGYTDEMKQDIFELFNECLIEMACTDKMAKYRGCLVSYAKVIDKINESIKFGDNNEYMTIQPFVDEFISEYETASKQYEISSHVAYMKSCIWNCFQTYKVKFHSTVTKMLNGYYEG